MNELDLLDWKRRVFELYADVRATPDPEEAWQDWRTVRDNLFRTHPQSPLDVEAHEGFSGLDYFAYDAALRVLADVEPAEDEAREIAGSAGSSTLFRRFGRARFELDGSPQALELYWLEGYGGGLFLPFGDTTSGQETYGGGRYLLDTVKGSDLGGDGGQLVLDFNFAYNPSCSYDPRWACPLTPPANRLAIPVRAGEKVPTN
ncbi:MAG: hypothetical protein JWM06_121 [Actinomycetia bacterium]|nr:hypothetical protein [Actinomycetes bacterium]